MMKYIIISFCTIFSMSLMVEANTLTKVESHTATVTYPNTSSTGVQGDIILFKDIQAMPGPVRLLWQAKGLKPGDRVTVAVAWDPHYTWHRAKAFTVQRAWNTFGGPHQRGNRPGVWMVVVPDRLWPDKPRVGIIPHSVRVRITCDPEGGDVDSQAMTVRWLLAQPKRIGMVDSMIGISPGKTHWGGIYWFSNIDPTYNPATGKGKMPQDALWALSQDYIQGVCIAIWWADVQPDGPLTAEQYQKTAPHQYMLKVFEKAKQVDKRVQLYIRGLNVARTNPNKRAAVPDWALQWWRDRGLPVWEKASRVVAYGKEFFGLWLEQSSTKALEAYKHLVVRNQQGNALYQMLMDTYKDQPYGFISLPSLCRGEDPGSFSWYGMNRKEYQNYLKRIGMTRAQWHDWVVRQFSKVGLPVFERIQDSAHPKHWLIINSTLFHPKWYAKPTWYDDFYKALMTYGGSGYRRSPRVVIAHYSIDGSKPDTKGVRYALTSTQYNARTPRLWMRQFWNLRAASQDGGPTWIECSGIFMSDPQTHPKTHPDGELIFKDLYKARQGCANAFNLGARSYEIWRRYLQWILEQPKGGQDGRTAHGNPGREQFYQVFKRYNKLFSLRNRLAHACNIDNFKDTMVR